jgi:hypothetical protein
VLAKLFGLLSWMCACVLERETRVIREFNDRRRRSREMQLQHRWRAGDVVSDPGDGE